MTFFSIIVPIYNTNLKFLRKCIDSLRKQDYSNYEIIYINDFSTDSEVIKFLNNISWKKNERIINHKKNFGLGVTRNTGIKNSNGSYLLFVDSDDWIDKNTLWKMNHIIISNNFDIFKINFKYVYRDCICNNLKPYDKITSMTWSLVIKKDFLLNNDISFSSLNVKHEDEYFLLKLLFYKPTILYINEFFYFYNKTNDNSIMNTTSKSESLFWMNKNLELFLNDIPNIDFSNLLSKHIMQYISRLPFYFLREHNNMKISFFLKNTFYFSKIISLIKKENNQDLYGCNYLIVKLIYKRFFIPISFFLFKYIYIKLKK